MILSVQLEVPDDWTPGNCLDCPYMYTVTYETEDDGFDDQWCCGIDNMAERCPLEKPWRNA